MANSCFELGLFPPHVGHSSNINYWQRHYVAGSPHEWLLCLFQETPPITLPRGWIVRSSWCWWVCMPTLFGHLFRFLSEILKRVKSWAYGNAPPSWFGFRPFSAVQKCNATLILGAHELSGLVNSSNQFLSLPPLEGLALCSITMDYAFHSQGAYQNDQKLAFLHSSTLVVRLSALLSHLCVAHRHKLDQNMEARSAQRNASQYILMHRKAISHLIRRLFFTLTLTCQGHSTTLIYVPNQSVSWRNASCWLCRGNWPPSFIHFRSSLF